MQGDQLSTANQHLLEMFAGLISSPDALKVAEAFRHAYSGPLKTVVARIGQDEHLDRAKAIARELDWRALHAAILSEQLEQGLSASSLKAVLQATAELQDAVGTSLVAAQPVKAGLLMYEYQCPNLERLPDFAGMAPARKSVVQKVNYPPHGPRIGSDAALFQGFLRIDRAGEYTFSTESLDGSRLSIDGKVVVDNDGRRHGGHGMGVGFPWGHHGPGAQERAGSIHLASGLHELTLVWFAHHHWEHGHVTQLVLRYEGPDTRGSKVDVPPDVLQQVEGEIPDQLNRNVVRFLQERLVLGSNEEVLVPPLTFYAGSTRSILESAPRAMRAKLAVIMMRQPRVYEGSQSILKETSDEVDDDVLQAFCGLAQQLAAQKESLSQPLQALRSLFRAPTAIIAGLLHHGGPLARPHGLLEGLQQAAESIGWNELVKALASVEVATAFDAGEESEARCLREPLSTPLAQVHEEYARSGMVDLSMLPAADATADVLLLFPRATRLFLPTDCALDLSTARKLLPSLQVLHLGTMMSAQQLAELEEGYLATKELWVPTNLTSPALLEMMELFPEPSIVAIAGSPELPAAAKLDNPDGIESPVFEIGDSVSEFTCVFEFQVQPHQVPGEVYQVCVGQWAMGHGDFVVGWSRHWAEGRDTILFQYEGNQGHGGRIMHGGKACGFNMSGALNDGEWHRVAVVYDANNNTCTLHVDGWEKSETQTWNHCNPLRLGKVTIGEQGAWTREGRRPDRRFPPGQLRNVKLFDQIVPPELLFGQACLVEPEIRELRRRHPGVQIIAQSIVPPPTLRKMLQRYRQDRIVDFTECQGLTKAGVSSLMAFFPDAEKVFIATCGCTPDLRVLPAPRPAGEARDWLVRVKCHRKRNEPEWKDLAAVFLSRAIAKSLASVQPAHSDIASVSEIMDLTMQLCSLGVEATDELDKERTGLLLVKQAFADVANVRLGLLDAATYHHKDGRSYLSALGGGQRAALARLILSSEDGFGMKAEQNQRKRLSESAPADVALLEAFGAVVGSSLGSAKELHRPLRNLRALFRGPLHDIVEAFDAIAAEDQWGVVRDAAEAIDWASLREAFSIALLKPRALKLKVKKQQCVTEEIVEAYEAKHASDTDAASICVVCAAEADFRLSTECSHYFCSTCAGRSLQAIKEAGQFPAYCPGCRADSALQGLAEPSVGRVQTPALALLERRGAITWEFQLQFLRQHTKDPEEYFLCPGKCGEYLVACSPEFMSVAKGEHEHEGFRRMMRLGECPCGAKMCVRCREVVATDHRGRHTHECPPDKSKTVQDPHEEESVRAMERVGKRCPNCGVFLEMNGGCDIMMCGTEAHGRLEKALANGGCGYQFHWESGEPAHTFYIGLNGQRVDGIVGRRD